MSGRFDDRATKPIRGPADVFKWKLGKKEPRRADWDVIDRARPKHRDGGAAVLASGDPVAVWIGHATWALRFGGKVIVIDPIWSRTISGAVGRLVEPGVPLAEMPKIDLVLVTHDHRDHLDLPTIGKLPDDGTTYIAPIGNGARLGKKTVVELDWWQSHRIDDVTITLVPARHWSMRMPWNRNDTLWGGYVIETPDGVAYHSGDTAWGDHFAEIAVRCPPIDWAMLPIGAYAPRWFMSSQHIDPGEAVRAFLALGAKNFLAMHWGTFRLTDEAIGEPPELLRAIWREQKLPDDKLWILDVGASLPLRSSGRQ